MKRKQIISILLSLPLSVSLLCLPIAQQKAYASEETTTETVMAEDSEKTDLNEENSKDSNEQEFQDNLDSVAEGETNAISTAGVTIDDSSDDQENETAEETEDSLDSSEQSTNSENDEQDEHANIDVSDNENDDHKLTDEETVDLSSEDSRLSDEAEPEESFQVSETDTEVTIRKYIGNSAVVVIPDTIHGKSVTRIGDSSFSDCLSITEVIMPDTIKYIERSAFTSCSKLNRVVLSSNLQSLGTRVFSKCSSLTELVIPASLSSSGHDHSSTGVFSGSSLQKVVLEDGMKYIPDDLFYNCSSTIKEVVIPESVNSIGQNAFYACALEEINLPDNITSIGACAFDSCRHLTSINLPTHLQWIGQYAFQSCEFVEIILPDTVTSIGHGVFNNCSQLEKIHLSSGLKNMGVGVFSDCKNMKKITVPSTVTGGYSAFSDSYIEEATVEDGMVSLSSIFAGAKHLKKVNLPDSIQTVEGAAFQSCTELESLELPPNVKSLGAGILYGCEKITELKIPKTVTEATSRDRGAFGNSNIQKIVIEDGMAYIPDYLCYGMQKLKDVVIPDSVTGIGGSALNGCSSLKSINLPSHLQWIGQYAFQSCEFKEIVIPDSVTGIGSGVFSNCSQLERIHLSSGLKNMGVGVFSDCKNLKEITVPSTVTGGYSAFSDSYIEEATVEDGMVSLSSIFAGAKHLKKVNLPDSIQTVEGAAFQSCTGLESLDLPPNVKSLGAGILYGCEKITELKIPKTVTEASSRDRGAFGNSYVQKIIIEDGMTYVPNYLCFGMQKLKDVVIPDSVTGIGGSAFNGCSSLKEIMLPSGLQYIGNSAFGGCSLLKEIIIPSSLNSVGGYPFSGSCVEKVAIKFGMETIPSNTFRSANNLAILYIPSTVAYIKAGSLSDCAKLKDIFYEGSEAQWESIIINSKLSVQGKDDLQTISGARIHFNAKWQDYLNSEPEHPVVTLNYEVCPALPTLSEDDARQFLCFLYNKSEYSQIKGKRDEYYKLLIGDYSSYSSADELQNAISEFIEFVTVTTNNQADGSEKMIEQSSSVMLTQLEKELAGMATLDHEIVDEVVDGWKKMLKNDVESIIEEAIEQGDIRLINALNAFENEIESVAKWLKVYQEADKVLKAPQKAKEIVDRAVALLNIAVYVLNGDINGRTMYFNSYYDNLNIYKDSNSSIFQTIVDGEFFRISQDNGLASSIEDFASWITGTDSWDNHREQIERWALFVYQFGNTPAAHSFEYESSEHSCEAGVLTGTCINCGDTFTKAVDGNTHACVVTNTPSTCTSDGYYENKCAICGQIMSSYKRPALGHSWDGGTVTTQPSSDTDGVMTFRCVRCGTTKEEAIEKITGESISVDKVFFYEPEITVLTGAQKELPICVEPENAWNKRIIWCSSNKNVVNVEDGLITARRVGSATVVAKSQDSGVTAKCIVHVISGIHIVNQPSDACVKPGDMVNLHIDAEGGNLKYQWQWSSNNRDWKNCTSRGYNETSFRFAMKESLAGRSYRCLVIRREEQIASEPAQILMPPIEITKQLEDITTAFSGERVKLTVEVDAGKPNYRWQWSSDGTTWKNCTSAGSKTDTFEFTMKASLAGRLYRCRIQRGTETVYSKESLICLKPVCITVNPDSMSALSGEQVVFHVEAEGFDLKYQWQWSSDGITWKNCYSTGCNTDKFSFVMKAKLNGRQYRCMVIDGAARAYSEPAVITIAE